MTRADALKEAWRRWGSMGPPRIQSFAVRYIKQRPRFVVGAYREDTGERVARGASDNSWESAFAHAEGSKP